MKNVFIVLFMLLGMGSFAQTSYPAPNVFVSPFSVRGQMLNLSNTNYQPVNDSTTNAGTLYLTISRYSTTTGLPIVYKVDGYGAISFIVKGLVISGTPGGNVTLQESFDGITWAAVRASTTVGQDTLTITTATPETYSWDKATKFASYYRLQITTSGTQSSSWQAWYFLNKAFQYSAQQ